MNISNLIRESLNHDEKLLNEQLRGKFAEWLASKIPGTSAQQMRKAVEIVAMDGGDCDDEEIARKLLSVIHQELLIALEPEIERMASRVIKAVAANYR